MGKEERLPSLSWPALWTALVGSMLTAAALWAYAVSTPEGQSPTDAQVSLRAAAGHVSTGFLIGFGLLCVVAMTKWSLTYFGGPVPAKATQPAPPVDPHDIAGTPTERTLQASVFGFALVKDIDDYIPEPTDLAFPHVVADDQIWRRFRDKAARLSSVALRGPLQKLFAEELAKCDAHSLVRARLIALRNAVLLRFGTLKVEDVPSAWDRKWPGDDPPDVPRFWRVTRDRLGASPETPR